MRAKQSRIVFNVNEGTIQIGHYPDTTGWSRIWPSAICGHLLKDSDEKDVLIHLLTWLYLLTVEEGMDADKVCKVFNQIDEFKEHLSY